MGRYIFVLIAILTSSKGLATSLCQSYFHSRSQILTLEQETLEAFEKAYEKSEVRIYTDLPIESLFSQEAINKILEYKNQKQLLVIAYVTSYLGQSNALFVDVFKKSQFPFQNRLYLSYERTPRFQSSGFLSKKQRQRDWYNIPGTYVRRTMTSRFDFEHVDGSSFFKSYPSTNLF